MGSAIAFDTLEYSKKLISVGFTEQQAEAQIELLKAIMVERLATKEDIAELKRDMKEMELRMTIKIGAMMAACIAIIAALVKLL